MAAKVVLTGDVNLMRVTDANVPFRHVAADLNAADVVFSNLECCLRRQQQTHANEGFFADPAVGGEALRLSGIRAVGIANNVNYGWDNISASIARLDEIGMVHTGAGANAAAARAPAVVERNGVRFGALQRSSVYWPTDHEAQADSPGIAVLKGHTAYHVPMGRISPDIPPANRPGIPPLVLTWADEVKTSRLKVNLFDPGVVATRLRRQAFPGEDAATLRRPESVASALAALCLPTEMRHGEVVRFAD